MARSETARLIAELSLQDKLTPGVSRALGSVDRLDRGFARVSRGAGQVAGGLARAGTRIAVGVGVGLGAAAKAAIDWEDAFAGVVKTVDEADLSRAGLTFDDIADGLRKMSTEMPNSAQELAGIAEQAGALGIAGKDILAFTKQVAILASTTNVSADDAATALGQLQNVIGLTGDEFDNFAAALVDLGNKGASTEGQILEIARRAGGAAKLFGIAKDETLGWAAAAANLGLNEELAGTALQNVFIKLLPKVQKGSEAISDIMGKSAKEVRKAFKEDASGALEEFIADLGKLPEDQRLTAVQKLFGKGSGITRLILGLADSVETNLSPALDTSAEAWEKATAAQIEFDKRNQTVRSSISRLKNGVMDAAITVGEGFVPALGRASDKLAAFLKDDQNRAFLKSIGEDIGRAIDDIDWKEVVDGAKSLVEVMKVALGFAKRLFDAFNALPTPLKGAAAGFLAIDKLSGGLLGAGAGNIIGGLGETVARAGGSRIPGVGKLFAQPVFVTNWPAGGLGLPGGPGAAGAGAAAVGAIGTGAALTAIGVAIGTTIVSTLPFANRNNAQAAAGLDREERVTAQRQTMSVADLETAFKRSFGQAFSKPIRVETISDPRDARPTEEKLEHVKNALRDQRREEQNIGTRTQARIDEAKRETQRGANIMAATTRGVAPPIVSAIQANRPIVNVDVDVSGKSVTTVVTKTKRRGPTSGSRNSDSDGSGTLGNGGR